VHALSPVPCLGRARLFHPRRALVKSFWLRVLVRCRPHRPPRGTRPRHATRSAVLDYQDYLDYAEVDATAKPSNHSARAPPGTDLANAERKYLRVHEVAQRLSLDESTVYKMIRSGVLPSVRIGTKAVRVPAERFEAYLQEIASEDQRIRDTRNTDANVSDDVATRLAAFVNTTGVNPFVFIDDWKRGSLDDNDENGELLIEALSLRTMIGRRVNETNWRVGDTALARQAAQHDSDRERASLFRRRKR
jgi:excisionase family DNA binding protein